MQSNNTSKFKTELSHLFTEKDNAQLSLKLLDLTHEIELPINLQTSIFSFRRLFLESNDNEKLNELGAAIIAELNNTELNFKVNTNNNQSVCLANNVSKQFTNSANAFKLQPISLDLKYGEITGIVGENGNGKTTLLRILAGELASDTGSIDFPALQTKQNDWYASKEKFVFIPQRIPKWYGSLIDNLHFFASIHGIKGQQNTTHVNYILLRLGLEKYKHLTWSQLSSGYRLRFELAKAIMWRPKLLILDEPLANLDVNAQQLFLNDLKLFAQSSTFPLSIIMSSQQLHEVESISTNIVFIKQGNTIYNGNKNQFATDRLDNTFEISGNFDKDMLAKVFTNNNINIDSYGSIFVVTIDKSVNCKVFLQELIKHQIPISYFRDISVSTRKLFHA